MTDLPPELRQRWAAARVWAAHQAPYLATAVLALEPVVVQPSTVDGLDRLPTDRNWHVYLDPAVLAAHDVPTLGFWLLHQATHLLREHADRYPGGESTVDRRRWNASGDAEINDDLCAGAVTLPAGAVTPEALGLPEGWTAEQYWDALGGSDEGSSPGPGPGRRPRGADAGDCGSGCDGQARPWDCDRPGLGRVGAELVRRDVAHRIRRHRDRGMVPAGWQRWAEGLLEPTVNWRRQLAAAVRHGVAEVAGRVDFTYRRPSRRAASVPDVVLPSLRQPLPRVAMVIDTSGSMGDDMLGQALGEVNGVLRSLGLGRRDLRVVCCDAQAYEAQRVFDVRAVRLAGGGGTDMGAGLAAAAALRPKPDLVIVLTDGHTPWPSAAPPGTRVVVGLMDRTGTTPGWATTVPIGEG